MSAGPAAPDPLLAQLGTVLPTRSASARSTAALLNNPSCVRRAVLDGARVDLGEVATRLGSPPQFGQSPFALGQGNRFERRVKANDYEELVRVVDELLGIFGGLTSLRSVSVERVPTNGLSLIEARARATADLLVAIATGDPTAPHVIDHGVTTLVVGGVAVYLEQDALAFREGERLRICEVKGFPIIDGSADPQKVGAAARQSASQSQQDRSVAGIAGTENSPERDADGRRLGGGASGDSPEDNPEDDSQPAAKSGLLRRDPRRPPDALGETGQRLDVTV